jgi:hypothetical protein
MSGGSITLAPTASGWPVQSWVSSGPISTMTPASS